ncbi:MAG: sigma-54-dependent Fis family transcriptional regulator [Planctomycetota bacterium]|nr:MAG: sigma-54-dependent Fis family transcriptional regulator [Planctomycetota bacterium]
MRKPRILVVEPDVDAAQQYRDALVVLASPDFTVVPAAEVGLAALRAESFDLLLVNIGRGQPGDFDALRQAREIDAELPIIVMTAHPSVDSAAAALRLGASDYLAEPIDPEALVEGATRLLGERRMEEEYELLRRQIERPYGFDDMSGGSQAMRKVFETIEQVAESDVDVLVVGETGTGKELVARSIHRRSRRADGPFVPVDCGAIPENLLESEFYGHEKGAFTGAESRRIGLLEYADGGTFFLDELGELPMLLQAKLLRTLQERKIRRVGGREEIDVDVRIVAATARNLDEMIRKSAFRQDLYYRINVVRIDLPPLRKRGDDIGLLIEYLAQRYGREMGREIKSITPEAYQVLKQYRWPGNVRELQNVLRRAMALAKGPLITLDDLPDDIIAAAGEAGTSGEVGFFQLRDQHMSQFENQYLSELLTRHHGDVRTAAIEAKLPRGTLYRLMKKHDLDTASFR